MAVYRSEGAGGQRVGVGGTGDRPGGRCEVAARFRSAGLLPHRVGGGRRRGGWRGVGRRRLGRRAAGWGAGRGMRCGDGVVGGVANSTVVAYRWSGSLAMPVAITSSNCAGHVRLGGRRSRRRGAQVCGDQLRHRGPGKRRAAGQALIQHARQRVDIGAGILLGSGAEPLRCDVLEGADRVARSWSTAFHPRRGRSRNQSDRRSRPRRAGCWTV